MKSCSIRTRLRTTAISAAIALAIAPALAACASQTPASSPNAAVSLPSAKASLLAAQQAAIASARLHPSPKSSSTTIPTDTPTSETPESGITEARQGPVSSMEFAVQNAWTGRVDGVYYTVFAGVKNTEYRPGTPKAGVMVYIDPANLETAGPNEEGVYTSGTGTSPLKIERESGGVLTLTDHAGHTVFFHPATHTFTR